MSLDEEYINHLKDTKRRLEEVRDRL